MYASCAQRSRYAPLCFTEFKRRIMINGEEFYRQEYPKVGELTLIDKTIIELLDKYGKVVKHSCVIPPVMGCFGYPKKFEDFFFANYDYDLENGWSHKFNKERPQDKITVAKVYQYWLSVNNNP